MDKKKILIIDDEMGLVELFSMRLQHEGYQVHAAFDAMQAMMQINKVNPDLILLDIMMPAGGGMSVLQNIRMNTNFINLPVIVMTGKSDDNTEKVMEKWGVSGYFIKPVDIAVLMQKIAHVLDEGEKNK